MPVFRCAVPEHVSASAAGRPCHWPHLAAGEPITVAQDLADLPGVGSGGALAAFGLVLEAFTSVGLPIRGHNTRAGANLYCMTARLGGPGGVLARFYLPCNFPGPTEQLHGEFDSGDRLDWRQWTPVIAHELLHGLGLGHAPAGTGSIQEPAIDLGRYAGKVPIDGWILQQLQARYPYVRRGGTPPRPDPDPDPPPPPPPAPRGRWTTLRYVADVRRGGLFGGVEPVYGQETVWVRE